MIEAFGRSGHVGAVGVERQHLLVATEHQVAAHARSQVDHHVDVGVADALDRLGVELGRPRTAARLGIAHVDVHHGGAGPRRVDRRVRRSARA